jgi:selenocysteine-specific elongation factor
MIIGTAGHIDHGKTSLVRALTGIETDRLQEEKIRGITIELGYAYQPIDPAEPKGARLGFVDMPGHERFIHTMLAGATGISFALLVIAADDGVMPQTREHLQILQLLGIRQGAVALTKTDLVSTERVAQVTEQLQHLLATTFLSDASVFPVSTLNGDGVPLLQRFLFDVARRWHADQAPAAAAVQTDEQGQQFRLALDRCFSIDGRGTIVTGTVHSGSLRVGDSVNVLPSQREGRMLSARVRAMHALNQTVKQCHAGQRVSLNLVGLERSALHRGYWVVADTITYLSERIAVDVSLLDTSLLNNSLLAGSKSDQPGKPLRHWSTVHVHVGAARTTAKVALLQGDVLLPGASMLAELALDVPLHVCYGDRIVLRDASAQLTIGGCTVLDTLVPVRGKRSTVRLALLAAQREPLALNALQRMLALESNGLDIAVFAANRNLAPQFVQSLLAQLGAVQVSSETGQHAFAPQHWQRLQQAVLMTLAALHVREPDYVGVERERLRRIALPVLPAAVFRALIRVLQQELSIVSVHNVFIALPTHTVAFSDAEQVLWQQIVPLLSQQPFQPPRVRPLAAVLGQQEEEVRRLLGKAARLGHAYLIAHDRYFLDAAVRALALHVQTLAEGEDKDKDKDKGEGEGEGEITVAPFRDRIGTGRKLAVEILEFFNRIGFTRRIHDRHLIRQLYMWK